jgi:hypothetical protein
LGLVVHVDEHIEGFFHFNCFVKTYGLSEARRGHSANIDKKRPGGTLEYLPSAAGKKTA